MKALITDDFVLRRLPKGRAEISDTKLRGFALRCRPSGYHSFLLSLSRGRTMSLGRLGKPEEGGITAADARALASALLSDAGKAALANRAADPALTLAQAKAKARDAVTARREARASAGTLGSYLTGVYAPWVTEHRKTGAAELKRMLVCFADLLDLPLSELSAFAIERWRSARLKTGPTPRTVNRDLAGLRGALSRAVEWKLIAAHPLEAVKDSKTDALEYIRYLSEPENTRLRAALAARDERNRAARVRFDEWRRERGREPYPTYGRYTDHLTPLVLLALNTGLRRGELLALVWRDIDLVGARLTVRAGNAKGARSRVVDLNHEAVSVLRAWRPAKADLDAPLFSGTEGAPLKEFKTAWTALLRAAKIADFRFHDCRHDFASRLVQAGVDLNTVRDLLGHADLKMTLRYAHLAPAQKAAAVALLVRA